eukprot:jgi/Mesvir1/15527/Mv03178-RA.1
MDWGNVTAQELLDAMKEVDWKASPRPLSEFFAKFTYPNKFSKWPSRLKCNLYYYRTNYFILVLLCFAAAFIRNPPAIVAVAFSALAVLCFNDTFAASLSERVTRLVRQVHPPLAARMRAPQQAIVGRPRQKPVHICGQPRAVVAGSLCALSALLMWWTGAVISIVGAAFVSAALTVGHATFRSPNLKARLGSFREEFRAVWRGYREF